MSGRLKAYHEGFSHCCGCFSAFYRSNIQRVYPFICPFSSGKRSRPFHRLSLILFRWHSGWCVGGNYLYDDVQLETTMFIKRVVGLLKLIVGGGRGDKSLCRRGYALPMC